MLPAHFRFSIPQPSYGTQDEKARRALSDLSNSLGYASLEHLAGAITDNPMHSANLTCSHLWGPSCCIVTGYSQCLDLEQRRGEPLFVARRSCGSGAHTAGQGPQGAEAKLVVVGICGFCCSPDQQPGHLPKLALRHCSPRPAFLGRYGCKHQSVLQLTDWQSFHAETFLIKTRHFNLCLAHCRLLT